MDAPAPPRLPTTHKLLCLVTCAPSSQGARAAGRQLVTTYGLLGHCCKLPSQVQGTVPGSGTQRCLKVAVLH